MEVNLYKCLDRKEKLNKTLTNLKILNGDFKNNISLSNIDLILTTSDVDIYTYNYCYIPAFNRYYFINSIDIVSKNRIVMKLLIDVLMSYKTDIERMTVKLNKSSVLFDDSDCLTKDNKELVFHGDFRNVFSNNPKLYMTCIKGDTENE